LQEALSLMGSDHFLFANAVYLPLTPPGSDTGRPIRASLRRRRRRRGETERGRGEKMNIYFLPPLHPHLVL